jgi:branched-chain amino acid transport system ATP-binding protein
MGHVALEDTRPEGQPTGHTKDNRSKQVLDVANLEVVYNDVILVLRGLSLQVPEGQIVALLGSNGAGKTTTLRAVSGLLDVHEGDITKGTVTWNDEEIHHRNPSDIVKLGITQVMEGRRVFAELTVEENLQTGAYTNKDRESTSAAYERTMELFPVLKERRNSVAGYLSGGEQQMLAIGRALMADPKLLILDEPSLGLAPLLVEQIRDIIVDINKQGVSVLLIEQNALMALSIADYGYIMENGKIVLDGDAAKLRADEDVQEFYLGLHTDESGDRRSFKDVKHYRRRKRWLS